MRSLLLSAAVVLVAGCGSDNAPAEVSGTLTYRGKPLSDVTLNLVYDAPAGESFSQMFPVGKDGTFAGQVPKAGTYKAVVTEPLAAMENFSKEKKAPAKDAAFPPKYRAADTSDVKVTVNRGKNDNLVIELKD